MPPPQSQPHSYPTTTTTIRTHHKTSNPYEHLFGYSRSVRRGPFIFVSGTTSIDPNPNPNGSARILHPQSAYKQAQTAFTESVKAIEALGGTKKDVVRVRMYVKYDEDCDSVGRAMRECFGCEEGEGEGDVECQWAATMIVGSRFIEEDLRVEVEVDAVVF